MHRSFRNRVKSYWTVRQIDNVFFVLSYFNIVLLCFPLRADGVSDVLSGTFPGRASCLYHTLALFSHVMASLKMLSAGIRKANNPYQRYWKVSKVFHIGLCLFDGLLSRSALANAPHAISPARRQSAPIDKAVSNDFFSFLFPFYFH
jgi:hypothetical protein